jgi:hypothetical protein
MPDDDITERAGSNVTVQGLDRAIELCGSLRCSQQSARYAGGGLAPAPLGPVTVGVTQPTPQILGHGAPVRRRTTDAGGGGCAILLLGHTPCSYSALVIKPSERRHNAPRAHSLHHKQMKCQTAPREENALRLARTYYREYRAPREGNALRLTGTYYREHWCGLVRIARLASRNTEILTLSRGGAGAQGGAH